MAALPTAACSLADLGTSLSQENDSDRVIDSEYARWRELKRMVIVYGLPREDAGSASPSKDTQASTDGQDEEPPSSLADGDASLNGETEEEEECKRSPCSLRGQIWKAFLGVETDAASADEYTKLVERGASKCDGDIRNDTFRTFRGDPAFAQRVPEEKLVRLLNVFINELVCRGCLFLFFSMEWLADRAMFPLPRRVRDQLMKTHGSRQKLPSSRECHDTSGERASVNQSGTSSID